MAPLHVLSYLLALKISTSIPNIFAVKFRAPQKVLMKKVILEKRPKNPDLTKPNHFDQQKVLKSLTTPDHSKLKFTFRSFLLRLFT